MRVKVIVFLVVVFIIFGVSVSAQEITATISGTVTDKTGAVVPEATVTVVNLRTSLTRTTTTTTAGVFFFNNLPIGDYRLVVEKIGFKKYEGRGLHTDVNDKLDVPVALELGPLTEQITVAAEARLLQTETAEVSNLVGPRQTQELPLNGRDFNQLIDLMPGVAPDSGRVGAGVGLFSDTFVSVNGNQSNSNLHLLDGQYNVDSGANGNLLVTPALESIEEFKILRNNYSAEFGEATGGIINVVTKSGGREFHGTVYEFARNDIFDATDPFLKAAGEKKSKLRFHNFGFTAGGPFWIPGKYNQDKSHDFFFTSFEWRREIRGMVLRDVVPSLRQRNGLLDPTCSVTPTPCTPQPTNDPKEQLLTGEANVDPSLIDPNAKAFLMRYPLPNADISSGANFIISAPEDRRDHQWLVRWDHNLGTKNTLMGRYIQMKQSLLGVNNEVFGFFDNFPSVNTDWSWLGRSAVVKLTTTFTQHLVNDFQFGYSRNNIDIRTGKTSDPMLASRAGFTYTELFPETSGSFPSMNPVESFGRLGNATPFSNHSDNFQFKDDIAYAFRKHNLKLGGMIHINRKLEPANGTDNETAGTFTFSTLEDLLLGNVLNYTEEQTQNPVGDRSKNIAFYAQDTWKVLPNLTLDLGLRWQFLGQVFAVDNNIANFRPDRYNPTRCSLAAFSGGLIDPTLCETLNGIVTPETPGVSRSTLTNHRNDWEPRIGLAWQPNGLKKFVIRAGVGIYHGRDAISQTSALGRQPPFDFIPILSNITFSQLAPGQLSPFNRSLPQPPLILQALEQHYDNPLSYQYSLGIQYELMKDTTFEVNYVGSHQIHLGRNRNINQVAAGDQLSIAEGLIADPNTLRPFLGYGLINLNERAGTSRYNSLQVFFHRRMSHGLLLQAAYTYSHNISDTINRDTEAKFEPVQDAFHPEADRGLTDQDQTQSLVLNYIWELPVFKKSGGVLRVLLGDWQLAGINTFRSGLPATVCIVNTDVAGTATGAGVYECQRPNVIGNPIIDRGQRTAGRYFNPGVFVVQPLGTFGNAGRNVLRGPGVNNWDLSIFKSFSMPWFGRRHGWAAAEKATLQFRADLFNVWNHVQFNGLNTNFVAQLDSNGLPVPGAQNDPSNSTFGTVMGARDPREIQISLKLIW